MKEKNNNNDDRIFINIKYPSTIENLENFVLPQSKNCTDPKNYSMHIIKNVLNGYEWISITAFFKFPLAIKYNKTIQAREEYRNINNWMELTITNKKKQKKNNDNNKK